MFFSSSPIVTGANTPVLRAKAAKVADPLAPEIQALIPRMFDIMHEAEGLGLAAPQINHSIRLAVIELEGRRYVFINPKITAASTDTVLFEEGCLSLPGQFFLIERAERLTLRYQDETGTARKLKATGLLAIAIQHELDHLDGVLIVDRAAATRTKHSSKQTHAPLSDHAL